MAFLVRNGVAVLYLTLDRANFHHKIVVRRNKRLLFLAVI